MTEYVVTASVHPSLVLGPLALAACMLSVQKNIELLAYN